ncbi:MAG: reductive dehalogenase, partial [candidate division Zixibacteria bacterium]|nr:reductive dehalogenase [candidate division Zixibacteria bacterium]
DTAFAREEYLPGTDKYSQYYARHPEYKNNDDNIRTLPPFLEEGGRYYDAAVSEEVKSIFSKIRMMATQVDGDVNPSCKPVEAEAITAHIKRMMVILGADDVGIARLNPMFVYSHVGRGPEKWGQPIENKHKFAIAFVIEMDYDRVETAPRLPAVLESAENYLKAAQISVSVARYIRALGYPARAHISDSNYQIMLPPVAHEAGLGELGRLGYLVTPKFGPRVRLGVVTTDLPLVLDEPITFGLQDFCEKCLKCAANCPSAAIVKNGKSDQRGVEKWQLDIECCYRYWRLAGTDCGLCMKVCPYSHPPTLVHNIVRAGTMRSSIARTMAVWGDDVFYGRRAKFEE